MIWQVGTNEALRGMDPARFDALLDEGLRRLAAAGSDVVLMDYQIAPRMPPEETRAVYRDDHRQRGEGTRPCRYSRERR